ncbi:hypothetical protein PQR02_22450 [Paraburkholderia sediminicola]|uniref:Uncharacterized protein n=1 Tax=Paraburkholderia rhynchosiae TaxID=487049 RepID=A0ACC7NAN4_9BURK
MAAESARPTPPRQTENDPNAGDRHLTQEQKQSLTNQPAPPKPNQRGDLPDPKEVGEAG